MCLGYLNIHIQLLVLWVHVFVYVFYLSFIPLNTSTYLRYVYAFIKPFVLFGLGTITVTFVSEWLRFVKKRPTL